MAKFAERLKLLRTRKGLSQQMLADQLGLVSKSSINMYERGEREPGLETMEAIADYFNVDMDYLYGKSDVENSWAALLEDLKTSNRAINEVLPSIVTGVSIVGANKDTLLFKGPAPSFGMHDDTTAVLLLLFHILNGNASADMAAIRVLAEIVTTLDKDRQSQLIAFAEFLDAERQRESGVQIVHPYQQKK